MAISIPATISFIPSISWATSTTIVSALVNSAQNIAFAQRKRTHLGRECLSCSFRPLCNGGCPKHRFTLSDDGRPNKNYFCDGYMLHLRHVLPIMQTLLTLMRQGDAPERIRQTLAQHYYRRGSVEAVTGRRSLRGRLPCCWSSGPADRIDGRRICAILFLHCAGFRCGTGINGRVWCIINAAHL